MNRLQQARLMIMTPEVYDAVGQRLYPGDVIVYSNRSGSNTTTTVSMILEVVRKQRYTWKSDDFVTKLKVRAYGNFYNRESGWQNSLSPKASFVECIDRVAKVPFGAIKEEMKIAFRPILTAIGPLGD